MRTVIRNITLSVLMVVGMASALCAQAADARDSLNHGVSEFRAGRFQSAVDYFTRATQQDPNFGNAYLYLGTAYSQMHVPGSQSPQNQDYAKKAIGAFESYLAKDPTDEAALAALAKIYQASNDYAKSRDTFLRLTKAAPLNAAYFYGVGSTDWIIVYNKQNPLPEAERARMIAEGLDNIDTALQLNPRYEEAMTYKNLLLRQKALLASDPVEARRLEDEATQWFNRALEARRQNQGMAALWEEFPEDLCLQARRLRPSTTTAAPPPGAQFNGALPLRIGGDVAQRSLINQVKPNYPEAAKAARVQDYVMLQAVIDRSGSVIDLKVLHGHPLLNEAAIDAVKQWRYQPQLLNGAPTEVVTTITVNFSFQ